MNVYITRHSLMNPPYVMRRCERLEEAVVREERGEGYRNLIRRKLPEVEIMFL